MIAQVAFWRYVWTISKNQESDLKYSALLNYTEVKVMAKLFRLRQSGDDRCIKRETSLPVSF
jgi:hypothetical protein